MIFFIGLQKLLGLINAPVENLHVGEDQFQIDGLNIPLRVDAAFHMDDIVVFKAAHHMDDSVHLPNIGKEFVPQALPLGSALHQAGDVHKFNSGGGEFFRMIHFSQLIQPLVGHGHHAYVGLDSAEGVVGRLGPRVCNSVEKGALAHVGQAHDSQFHRLKSTLSF